MDFARVKSGFDKLWQRHLYFCNIRDRDLGSRLVRCSSPKINFALNLS